MKKSRLPLVFRLALLLTAIIFWCCLSNNSYRASAQQIDSEHPTEVIELTEDNSRFADESAPKLVEAKPLSLERLKHLASSMPDFTKSVEAFRNFELPSYTRTVPRVNDAIQLPFPPKPLLPSAKQASVQVKPIMETEPVNVASINLAGALSEFGVPLRITFNQAVIPMTTAETSDTMLPAILTPQPLGVWHWVDTKTIEFQPQIGHFANATAYRVTIPAGTTFGLGQKLGTRYESTFETAAPALGSLLYQQEPDGAAASRRPVLRACFNQEMDPSEVIKFVHGTVAEHPIEFRLANDDEINESRTALGLINFLPAPQMLVMVPKDELPKDQSVEITFDAGIPSIEGQIRSKERRVEHLVTYHPLEIRTGTLSKETRFLTANSINALNIEFNNNLDEKTDDKGLISISPAVTAMHVKVVANRIFLQGNFKVGVKYHILISRNIRDLHGQALTGANRLTLSVVPSAPQMETLYAPYSQLIPASAPVFKVRTLNESSVKVSVYDASITDWHAYIEARQSYANKRNWLLDSKLDASKDPFSHFNLLSTRSINISAPLQTWKSTFIDLKPEVKSGAKHLIVTVESIKTFGDHQKNRIAQWIEYSPLNLQVYQDQKNFYVMAGNAVTGASISGAEIKLYPSNLNQKTDSNGMARFSLPDDLQSIVCCEYEGNTLMLPRYPGKWSRQTISGMYKWYSNTDRNLYRPGESVSVTGYLRWVDWDSSCELNHVDGVSEIAYAVVCQSDRSEIAKGHATLNSSGAFDFKIPLPRITELGACSISMEVVDAKPNWSQSDKSIQVFQIAEFRRPEFELALKTDKHQVCLGDTAIVTAKSTNQTGSAVSHAKVHWRITSSPSYSDFTPPNLRSFNFGRMGDRNFRFRGAKRDNTSNSDHQNNVEVKLDGITSADGTDAIKIRCSALAKVEPINLRVETTVQDLSRQEWSEGTSIEVLPSNVLIGMRFPDNSESFNPQKSKPMEFVVSDKDGNLQDGVSVHVSVTQIPREDQDLGKAVLARSDQLIDLVSRKQPSTCNFDFLVPGNYLVSATVKDKNQHANYAQLSVHVKSSAEIINDKLAIAQQKKTELEQSCKHVNLLTDKLKYALGQTAQVSVRTPFEEGHGALIVRKSRILEVIPFDVKSKCATIPVKIDERYYPQVQLDVEIMSACGIYGSDTALIQVPPDPFALKLIAKPEKDTYEPGQMVSVNIGVKDEGDKPVENAMVALAVVDESILSLTGYRWDNPFVHFYATDTPRFGDEEISNSSIVKYAELLKRSEIVTVEGRRDINLFQVAPTNIDERHYTSGRSDRTARGGSPGQLAQLSSVDRYTFFPNSGGLVPPPPPAAIPFKVRSDLNPLAYYNPSVLTDKDGTAHVTFKLPDNLTKYRIMAVSVKGGKQAGSNNESTFTVNMPLMVHPSFPRFLNFMDQAELSLLLENNSEVPVNAELILHAKNLLLDPSQRREGALSNFAGRCVSIPAHDRVEIRVPTKAQLGGEAVIQAAANAGASKDAAEIVIPLQAPVSAEEFATYGQVDRGAIAQKIVVPRDVIKEVGGLKISTSSTAMQRLFDPAKYLVDYPFDCSEQLSSRILGLSSLGEILKLFPTAATGISSDKISAIVERDADKLQERQNKDGGFAMWSKSENDQNPFVSIQCTKALQMLSERKFHISPGKLQNSLNYLRAIQQHIPSWYGQRERFSLRAYALNVRQKMDDRAPGEAHQLILDAIELSRQERAQMAQDKDIKAELQIDIPRVLSLETMAWLLPVLDVENQSTPEISVIRNLIAARVSETSSTANIEDGPYGENWYLMFYSRKRMESVILESLIRSQPSSDVIPKLAKGLLLDMNNGRWSNTQENAYALMALSKYFATYEKITPDFTALSWLGNDCILNEKFAGRSLDFKSLMVPMAFLINHPLYDSVILQKDGDGRMYYRLGLRYALKNPRVAATSRGFSVRRTYDAVDAKTDVQRGEDGKLHVKAGATVKVTINIDAPGTRYHVAMVDPFPAGFEALSQGTKGTRNVDDSNVRANWGRRRYAWWYEHQNLRDNQAEAFCSKLYSGHYEYTYFARATTLGSFIAPPCKVEEMYTPETFGRTATEEVVID